MAGAVSVILFIITCILSVFVYKFITQDSDSDKTKKKKKGGSR